MACRNDKGRDLDSRVGSTRPSNASDKNVKDKHKMIEWENIGRLSTLAKNKTESDVTHWRKNAGEAVEGEGEEEVGEGEEENKGMVKDANR